MKQKKFLSRLVSARPLSPSVRVRIHLPAGYKCGLLVFACFSPTTLKVGQVPLEQRPGWRHAQTDRFNLDRAACALPQRQVFSFLFAFFCASSSARSFSGLFAFSAQLRAILYDFFSCSSGASSRQGSPRSPSSARCCRRPPSRSHRKGGAPSFPRPLLIEAAGAITNYNVEKHKV